MKDKHFVGLDILKTIGFIMVFLVHYSQMFSHMNYYLHSLLKYGQTGCQLFLVVSGYLMAHFHEQCKIDNYFSYFLKRYISLFSGYIFAVVLYCLISEVIGLIGVNAPFMSDLHVAGILINVLLLNGIVPFCNNTVVPGGWYVGTIIVAYALLPHLLNKIRCLKKMMTCACICAFFCFAVGVLLTCCFDIKCGNNTFYFYSIACQSSPLLVGGSIYYYEKEKGLITLPKSVAVFAFFSCVTLLLFFTDMDIFAPLIPFIVSLSFVGLFFLAKHLEQRLYDTNSGWTIIGINSFGCYLLHFVFALYLPYYVKRLFSISDDILFVLMIIPCFVLAVTFGIVFNRLINKNTLLLKKMLKTWKEF